jgi:hypothetical protein
MLMKKYRCSEDACLAALCHSLYGTEYFNHKTIDRDQLVNLIGEKAERMVEVFCSPDRDRKIQESGNRELLYLLYANEVELSTRPGNHPEFSFFSQIKNQLK